jgi:acetylornithine deacetylase/succinyl-diaminopimelate desuccinylase-like protein
LVRIEEEVKPELDERLVEYLSRPEVRAVVDEVMGSGASENVLRPTVNVGVMRGGIKVNMIPDRCVLEVDIRLPIGLGKEAVLRYIDEVLMEREFLQEERNMKVEYAVQEAASNPSSYCAMDHEMVDVLARVGGEVTGRKPLAIPSLGATDAKFWRYHGVPAFVYGVSPETMAAAMDERVSVEEFLSVVKVHAAAVWEYLGGGE